MCLGGRLGEGVLGPRGSGPLSSCDLQGHGREGGSGLLRFGSRPASGSWQGRLSISPRVLE